MSSRERGVAVGLVGDREPDTIVLVPSGSDSEPDIIAILDPPPPTEPPVAARQDVFLSRESAEPPEPWDHAPIVIAPKRKGNRRFRAMGEYLRAHLA